MTPRAGSRWPRLYARDWRLLALVAVSTFALLYPYLQYHLPRFREPGGSAYAYDEGTFLYHSWRISMGDVLYRDFFDYKGIVGYLPTALVYSVAGPSFVAGRITQFLVVVAISLLLYVDVFLVTGRRWSSVAAALFVPLIVWPTWPVAYHDLLAQVFVLLAICLGLRSLRSGEPTWFWVGVCCALTVWTTLAQGVVAVVCLPAAAVMVWLRRRDGRGLLLLLTRYALGVGAVAAIMSLYAVATGSFVAMLREMFVFPLTSYASVNATRYAEDLDVWVSHWRERSVMLSHAAHVIGASIALAPWAASVTAAGIVVATLATWRRATAAPRDSVPDRIERLLLVCPAAAAAFPVLVSSTRSDLCHIGFVTPGAVLVVMSALALQMHATPSLAPVRVAQWLGVLAVSAAVTFAGWFHLSNATGGYERRAQAKLEKLTRADFGVDSDLELLQPNDYTVHLPAGYYPGGFAYLLSKKRSAISFSILEQDGEYFAGQWPVAADEIVSRRPRLMKITQADLDKLAGYRPEIRKMYFGNDGRYMLDARRPGPDLPAHTEWTYVVTVANRASEKGAASIDVTGARLAVTFHTASAATGPLLGSVDGDRIAILSGSHTYVCTLSSDGARASGHVYETATSNDPLPQFEMKRVEAVPVATAAQRPGEHP